MTVLSVPSRANLPALVDAAGERAAFRFLEFFAANIRNPHTRRAYARAAADFLIWCAEAGVPSITDVQPLHVATWIEAQGRIASVPTVKQQLAALRHLFDWLVVGQVVAVNPAASVRGPRHVVRVGKTPVLDPAEARALLDSIDVGTVIGLRDRALIGLMVYSFARVGAALAMRVEDIYPQSRRLWVRLREKGGKAHALPCHHTLDDYLVAYLDGSGLRDDPKGPLFRTIGRGTGRLSERPLPQASAHAMVRRRAIAAGIATPLGCHSFRATGITAYLANGGTLETAAAMANHASTRTTQLYDRRGDRVSLDEVERSGFEGQIWGMLAGLVRGRHGGPFGTCGWHASPQVRLSGRCLVSKHKLDHNPTYGGISEIICLMIPLSLMAPGDVARSVAARARARRVALGLTQQEVADRSGVNIWTLRRFEASGKLAFDALIRVAVVLNAIEAFGALFPEPEFRSLDEVIDRPKRQRGKRRTAAT